jgi:hypothetical protein
MKFRLGLVIGFAGGYYLGTMAGRERHEQINQLLNKARRSDTFETASEKAKAVVDLGVERAKDVVEEKFTDNDDNTAVTTGNGMGTGARPPWPSAPRP